MKPTSYGYGQNQFSVQNFPGTPKLKSLKHPGTKIQEKAHNNLENNFLFIYFVFQSSFYNEKQTGIPQLQIRSIRY